MSKITDMVRAWTAGGGQSENERLLSLESGDAWDGAASGRVLTSGDPPTWEESAGGGGVSGITPDPVNAGEGALAMFPTGDVTIVQFTLYDPNLAADGTLTGPNACYAYGYARDGFARVSATTWSSAAQATMTCASPTDDTGAFVGTLSLAKDEDAPASAEAVVISIDSTPAEGELQTVRVLYDGRVQWNFMGNPNYVAITATQSAPDNADGDDGDWAFGGDGHVYFKALGVWVLKI